MEQGAPRQSSHDCSERMGVRKNVERDGRMRDARCSTVLSRSSTSRGCRRGKRFRASLFIASWLKRGGDVPRKRCNQVRHSRVASPVRVLAYRTAWTVRGSTSTTFAVSEECHWCNLHGARARVDVAFPLLFLVFSFSIFSFTSTCETKRFR